MEEKEDEDEEEASHTILIANVTNVHAEGQQAEFQFGKPDSHGVRSAA